MLDVPGDQPVEPGRRDEVVAGAQESQQSGERADREARNADEIQAWAALHRIHPRCLSPLANHVSLLT